MKRLFDLVVTFLAAVTWVPALLISCIAIVVFDGRPVFYVSRRRVYRDQSIDVYKFRTMRRDADKIANRQTVPQEGVRFLNIPNDSPLYTRVGRMLERLCFTELPQLLHVLAGRMSLVGNRPLPENVVAAIKRDYPQVEERFDTPAGLTGPVQLAGRERLSDDQRLALEIHYCRLARSAYSMRLDFLILLYTVVVVGRLRRSFTFAEIEQLLAHFGTRARPAEPAVLQEAHVEAVVAAEPLSER